MADDLDDEWWLSPKEQTEKNASKEEEYASTKKKKNKDDESKKRSHNRMAEEMIEEDTSSSSGLTKKNRKRHKKKKCEEHENKEETAGKWEDVVAALHNHFNGKIPVIEMEDLLLSEESFLPSNEDLNDLSTYLSFTIRKWKKLSTADDLKPKSPIVLVISSAAKRAVDLNREAKDFKGECSSAKLFAKHMKITEQAKFLTKNKVHFAVG
ncbi:protein CMSS1-like, partial [Anneissia japonica]|uniref:protein CMSS1-like n=1 Tax=Anneissia japonica TaxID=1529436 RepID=UPI0014259C0C